MQQEILKLNEIGLIPGPGESAEEFAMRADYCLHLKDHLPSDIKAELKADTDAPEALEGACFALSKKYGLSPQWIPLIFSNFKLLPWHGGSAWIFQMTEGSPTAAFIQLRKKFAKNKKYLSIYDRDELLIHELCHAGRMKFQEPKYEEALAYRTSNSKFRRFFGPMFKSSFESVFFLLILVLVAAFDFFLAFTNTRDAALLVLWSKAIPACLIMALLFRLTLRKRNLDRCLATLKNVFKPQHAEAVLYRLTDEEIDAFSRWTIEKVKQYALGKSARELRWEVIVSSYF